jgi:hypothetical protein
MKLTKHFLVLLLVLLLACCAQPEPEAEPKEQIAESTEVSTAVPTTATPAPTAKPAPTATAVPTPAPTVTPEPTPFGILWLPDTQTLSYYFPEKLETLGKEIVALRDRENLIAAVHTGDIVDNGTKSYQWDNFDLCLNAFIDRIPFYAVAGNHDIAKPDSSTLPPGDYSGYLEQPFLKRFPQEQLYEGGKMLYGILNEGTDPILLLCVGFEMGKEPEQLAWIDEVIRSHADMPCILAVHGYQSKPEWIIPYCRYIENDVVSKYPSIRYVLCGHARGFFHDTALYDDDGDGEQERTVHVLMFNDQEGAFLYRVLRVDMIKNTIAVKTFEIGTDRKIPDDPIFRQPADFTIENAF